MDGWMVVVGVVGWYFFSSLKLVKANQIYSYKPSAFQWLSILFKGRLCNEYRLKVVNCQWVHHVIYQIPLNWGVHWSLSLLPRAPNKFMSVGRIVRTCCTWFAWDGAWNISHSCDNKVLSVSVFHVSLQTCFVFHPAFLSMSIFHVSLQTCYSFTL